jgi:two-component system chemotaxis sensor kinase CheA
MDLDDRELLEELIIESQEHLGTLEPDLLALEKGAGPEETAELVNRIFRGIHSIKGGCGFLGITPVQNLTHQMESVLMKVRSGKLGVTPGMVDILLEGTDRVREMLDDVASCGQVDATAVLRGLEPFLAEEAEVVAEPEETVAVEPEETEADPPEKPRSGFIPLQPRPTPPVAEEPEELNPVEPLPDLPTETRGPVAGRSQGHNEVLRVKVDLLNQLMNLAGELVLARNQMVQSLDNKLADTPSGEAIYASTRGTLEDSFRRVSSVLNEHRQKAALDEETARVLTEQIQREFHDLTENLMKALPNRLSDLAGMNASMVNIDAVTTNLQENIMRTRLQAIDAVFGKLPRQVRKLAQQVGKEVELVVSGNEVELDKSIIESLSDPLNHLIRNSLDHGFEDPAGRREAGKPTAGKLMVRAFHEGGQVIIEIEDDGRGINPEVIKRKAVEKGVISPAEAERLDDRQAVELIFAPGFSTAEQVSDISGRGVGMDVVRTNIEDLGGAIDLDSRWGKGTRMRLKLPLTLAIIPSLLIRAGGRRFAVPQVSLDELVRLRKDDPKNRIEEVRGAEVLRLRGKLLPLVRLKDLLGMAVPENTDGTTKESKVKATHVLVLKSGNNRYGLIVDEVLDSEEIVVKQLPSALKDSPCYAGATIMGDGSVAMILDVVGIAEFSGLRFIDSRDDLVDEDTSEAYRDRTEGQTLLLFTNAEGGENFALNLALISRIEQVPSADITRVGGKEFLKYRDTSLRLVRLHDHMPVAGPAHDPEEVFVIIPKLVKHPMGIVAHDCHDVITTRVEVERENLKGPGVLGSAVLDGVMTLFLDIYSLFEAVDPDTYRQDQARSGSIQGARVLLAEDTSFFRAVEKKYLESLGAVVTSTMDGKEAWDTLGRPDAAFDLVVTDLEMPKMGGLELTRHIRSSARWRDIPVVALTSLGSPDDREAGIEAGVTAYETKLDKDRLAATLRQVMEGVCAHA